MKYTVLFLVFSFSSLFMTAATLPEDLTILDSDHSLIPSITDGAKQTHYASIGTAIGSSEDGRTRYTSNDIYSVLPYKNLVDLNRKNTVFVNCGDEKSSSGFVLNVRSYLNSRPESTFNQTDKDKFSNNCDGRLVLTAGHVAKKYNYNPQIKCGIYHQDKKTGFSEAENHNVHISTKYVKNGYRIIHSNNDYAFLKLDSKINKMPEGKFSTDRLGLNLCNIHEFKTKKCSSNGKRSVFLSQSYGAGVDELMLSDPCCIDTTKENPDKSLAHLCHSEPGASGGPLISVNDVSETSCVLGIHTGSDQHDVYNHAVPIHTVSFRKELDEYIRRSCQ